MLFRRARNTDLDAIHYLAEQSGIGITTLPKDKSLMKQRLSWSDASYKKEYDKLDHEYYFFVLEDVKKQRIVGTSAIETNIGFTGPFYSYKISKHTRICYPLKIRDDYEMLNLVNDNQGKTELCTLFLHPEYRKNNHGLLLSKGRFLFMYDNPSRFSSSIIAEIRGVSDEHGESPFWQHVGSHFFHIAFSKADELTVATNKQFIADLMPRWSIYIKLLPKEAQEAIGQPHSATIPAMNILLNEGFTYNEYIDIFDGGPTIEAPLSAIKTITQSRIIPIGAMSDEVRGDLFLLSNASLDFRATIGPVLINQEKNHCIISKDTAELLNVSCGHKLCIAPLKS